MTGATDGDASARAAEARERARGILRAEAAASARLAPAGYLDLLGDPLESTGRAQDLMTGRVVPTIYERWWRPALGRLAKGPTGPGMSDEVRIATLSMGLSRGDVVLDLACGPGNFSRSFARAVGEAGLVVGLDASDTMLARGVEDLKRAGIGNLALIRGDATALPFGRACFDGVCCFGALHLFAEPFEALSEIGRVTAPGGRVAIMTSIRRRIAPRAGKALFERMSGMLVFEPGELTAALRTRGFDEVHERVSGVVQFVEARKRPAEAP